MTVDREQEARENILKKAEEVSGRRIRGYDFNEGVDYEKIVAGFGSVGFQASNFSRAVEITNKMIEDSAFILLGCTSNMVSSGNREAIRYLVQHKKVGAVVMTVGGVEEDIAKCFGDFYLGDSGSGAEWKSGFRASGKELRGKGVNRIGNIFVSNNRYIEFEKFMQELLEDVYTEGDGKVVPCDLIWKMGEKIGNEDSICYWAWKNGIRIFCPAIQDGALGDNIYFFKFKREDFVVDAAEEMKRLNDSTAGLKKSGVLVLGAGVVKHSILNANLYRNGADYAVFINTAAEYDGSDAGAVPEEAVSWGKLLPDSESVKVHGDATILFPLLVAGTFAKEGGD